MSSVLWMEASPTMTTFNLLLYISDVIIALRILSRLVLAVIVEEVIFWPLEPTKLKKWLRWQKS
jgi:hypothetical protein